MHVAQLDTRTNNHRHRQYGILLAAALLVCPGVLARAAAMQNSPPPGPMSPPTSEAFTPTPGGVRNAPREPDRASADQMAQHSLITFREQLLSYSILLFGLAVLIVQYLLLRSPKRNSYEILQLLAINLIVTGTLFLISAGISVQQISPALGLFGTIAGYVLGRRAVGAPKGGGAAANDRGAP